MHVLIRTYIHSAQLFTSLTFGQLGGESIRGDIDWRVQCIVLYRSIETYR